jgi:hypothetical protein
VVLRLRDGIHEQNPIAERDSGVKSEKINHPGFGRSFTEKS